MKSGNGFYLVWCEQKGLPTHKHDNFEEAKKEAERLALKYFGLEFIILRAETGLIHQSLQEISYLPF